MSKRHDELGRKIDALRGQIATLETSSAPIRAAIGELLRKLAPFTEKIERKNERIARLKTQQRQCRVRCEFCQTEAFKCDDGKLPAGWTRRKVWTHEGQWEDLECYMKPVCPNGHRQELAEHNDYHLNHYESVVR
jgi:hypothetical protein